jgi:ketosteroid isomerase-like protein
MSQNVDIVRQLYEALDRRDWDKMAELLDPDVEQLGTVGGLEEEVAVRGLDAIRQRFEVEDDDVWDEHRMEPARIIDAGDQVVGITREYQRGKGSGVEIESVTAVVIDIRDGRVVRIQPYMDPAAALKAVGLSEQGAPAEFS